MRLVRALAFLGLLAVAPLVGRQVASAQTEQENFTRQWGVLAGMIGRGYAFHADLISARWIDPGHSLELIFTSGGKITKKLYILDAATGDIVSNERRMTVLADGTLLFNDKKPVRVLAPLPGGGIAWWNGMQKFQPMEAGSKQARLMEELIARGELARPGEAAIARSASEVSRQATTAIPATPLTPAAPPSADQRSGLDGYIGGGVYAVVENGQQIGVLRLRWLTPGRRYEVSAQNKFGAGNGIRVWELADDGSLQADGPEALRGTLSASGLPVVVATNDGTLTEIRIEPAPAGFLRRVSQNTAKPGKPPKLKLISTKTLTRIDPAAADRLAADWDAERRKRWSPLAVLTERQWFCAQTDPLMWSTRNLVIHRYGRASNRSYPTTRLTTARWIVPLASIEIRNVLGDGRVFTDTISERADGTLSLTSVGHGYFNQAVGRFGQISISQTIGKMGNVYHQGSAARFPLKTWPYNGSTFYFELSYGVEAADGLNGLKQGAPFSHLQLFGYDRDPICAMVPYDPADAERQEALLKNERDAAAYELQWDEEYWAGEGAYEAEARAMRANMDRQLFGALMGIPRAVAEVRQQNAELANLRRAAEEETRQKQQAAADAARRGSAAAPVTPPAASVASAGTTRPTPGQPGTVAPTPPNALAPSHTAAQAPRGTTMYGFCWASQTNAGDSPIYHSQIGRIDNYLNGGTTDLPNEAWIHRMEREFAGQIGAHTGLICYENASPSGFDYNISMNTQGHPITQVPWRPH